MNYRLAVTYLLSFILFFQLISLDIDLSIPVQHIGSISTRVAEVNEIRVKPVLQTVDLTQAWENTPSNRTALVFVGDVLLARNIEYLMSEFGSDYPYHGFTFSDLSVNPYVIGNFEAVVPEEHVPTETNKIKFSVDERFVSAAYAAGFTHFSLANNHAMDFGPDGLQNTINVLKDNKLNTFGDPIALSKDAVTFIDLQDTTVALIGLQALTRLPNEFEVEDVLNFASQKSDIQVIFIHWGTEYSEVSNKTQRLLAQQFVTAGADLIIGHHPHVVQEVELIDGVPVFYSLGNFIFDQYAKAETQTGLVVMLDTVPEPILHLIPVSSAASLSQPTYMTPKEHSQSLDSVARRSDVSLKTGIRKGSFLLNMPVASSSKTAMID